MRILLDECIDRRFANQITGHSVATVGQMAWAGLKNGELLSRAQDDFDVFVTVDQNLRFQQNLSNFRIAVIVLRARSNRLNDLEPFAAKIETSIDQLAPGKALLVE